MGKQGPCYHCGVTSTPLWRNGPPEKPVLCNACGSRWRTKGTLLNYTPLHSRLEPVDYDDHHQHHRVSRLKNISVSRNEEIKLVKRKAEVAVGGFVPDYSRKVLDEDVSNRSSSGSAISNSESCAQLGSIDASEFTGSGQTVVWDSTVPSRKRTCVNRPKQSSVEKLTKDLYTIWHEQQSSCFSASSEEDDLLFESETPMVSVEIGHGSVLIRHPSSIAQDEESEASSLSVDNNKYRYSVNEAYSGSVNFPGSKCIIKTQTRPGQGMQQQQLIRDKSQHEKVQVLASHKSPLCNIDLNCVVNFEEFAKQLTDEEQQQLLKYLPPVDSGRLPESIREMFDSSQFKENLSSYQQLLAEGVFDLSFKEAKTEDCKTLKRLTLSNFSKSKWVEHYNLLKKCRNNGGKSPAGKGNHVVASNFSSSSQRIPEMKMMRSPKRSVTNASYVNNELMDNEASYFSPKSLFALPPEESLNFVDDGGSEQDLLLDVPSNGSFPQAELLYQHHLHPPLSNLGQQATTSSSSIRPNHLLHRP